MKSRTIVSTFFLATLAIGTILVSTKTGANVVTDNVSLAIPVSCSMSSTINSGNEHTDSVMPGTYTKDIGTTNIKVICNDFSGFSIYAIGYTNNTEGNNTMLGTNTNQTIITGTNTSGNVSNWAMRLIKVENGAGGDITYNPGNLSILNDYNAYHAVPDTLTKVAEYKATTGSSTTDQTLGSNIQTTYAAFISGAQAPDTYVGKVKYILIHPATLIAGNYSIAYYAAGGSGTMSAETNIKNYEPHTLATNTFTAPAGGYTFKEWCTAQDSNATPSSPQTTCDGISYANGAIIPVGSEAVGSILNLYAVWEIPAVVFKVGDNIETIIVAANTSPNKPYYASSTNDIRFNNPTNGTTYTVTVVPKPNYKLGSWSTNATNTGLASETLLTTTYTVNGSETLTANGVTGSYDTMMNLTLANCSTTGTNVTDTRNGRSYTVQKLSVDTNNTNTSFCFMLSNLRLDAGTTLNNSTSHVSSSFTLPTENWTSSSQNYYCKPIMKHYAQLNGSEYRDEYYYNWYAARANPYECDSPTRNTNATTTNDSKSLGDICPRNWAILVDGGGDLYINNSTFRTTLLNSKSLATSGVFKSGSQGSVGISGLWWSRTRYDNGYAYNLGLDWRGISRDFYYKNGGIPVRCMRSS